MKLELLTLLNTERTARRAAVIVTDMANGDGELVKASDLARAPLAGTAKGEAIAAAIRQGKSAMFEDKDGKFFLNAHVPDVKVMVVGAVHISQAMVPIARTLGLELIIIDPRTAFATSERFPDVKLIPDWPDSVLLSEGIDRYTAFVALTHDPKIDDPGLEVALKAGCFYIGALGSRKTHAARMQRLAAAGFASEMIERIHAPIGLNIGAISPAEIALAILGEIVAKLRKAEVA